MQAATASLGGQVQGHTTLCLPQGDVEESKGSCLSAGITQACLCFPGRASKPGHLTKQHCSLGWLGRSSARKCVSIPECHPTLVLSSHELQCHKGTGSFV